MSTYSKNQKILSTIFSILNFCSATILIVVLLYAISLFKTEINMVKTGLIVSVIITLISFIVVFFLDRSKVYSEALKQFKWIGIFGITVVMVFVGMIYFLTKTSFQITLDTDDGNQLQMLGYLAGSVIFSFIGYIIYFGLKNVPISKLKTDIYNKNKFITFAGTSFLIFLILSTASVYAYMNFFNFPRASVLDGIGHNDGPWLTWYNNQPNDSICITWFTEESNSSVVYYGTDPNNLDQTKTGLDGLLHKVYLTDLTPDTQYFYKIPEIFEIDHLNTTFNFTTASNTEESFKFAVYGDVQPTDVNYVLQNQLVADGLINGSFDFILQTGDIASSGNNLDDWHRYMQSFARVGANVPMQFTIGNHDWDGTSGSSNWGEIFEYPYQNEKLGRYYSFDYHNAHFVMVDNFERTYTMSQMQYDWIEADIEAARVRDPDCWVFVFFHLSLMTTATSGHYYDLQKTMVPLYDELGVDSVFYGHDHHYEHYNYTYGDNGYLYNKDDTPSGNPVQYFCTGGGGANLEVSYGVLNEDRMLSTSTVQLWDISANQYVDLQFERRPWNSSRFITNEFAKNYTTDSITGGSHNGKYYYYEPSIEKYNDFAETIGFDYGEQAFQFMQVEINGDTCTISARYPNGVLMTGPGGINPQIWTFNK